jgi:hypothetical protein
MLFDIVKSTLGRRLSDARRCAPTDTNMTDVVTAVPDEAADFEAWVSNLQPHPLAADFPLTEGDDYNALVEDIQAHGIRIPIMLHEGKVLDGRNRLRAGIEAGHQFTPKDFTQLTPGADPEAYVLSANLQRRNLDNKGKRAVIAKLIERKPGMSDRALGRLAGVDPKTVASVRAELADRAKEFIRRLDELSPSQWATVVAERRAKLISALGL